MVESKSSKKTTRLGKNKEVQNPNKFYSRFLFKALILAVLCAVVPVFLSQSPELANQTRLLELLHLVFVGIVVSYGLFSRRNNDGSNNHKSDHHNSNSYVPKILEVSSSVFNVDHHHESESEDSSAGDYSKIQTWKNKHHMKIPEIVQSKADETRFGGKPLLLPVRSLNYSRVSDSGDNSGGGWEKVRSKKQLLKNLGDDVLPSPIPWRSRSSSATEIESRPSVKNLTTVESQPLIKTPSSSFSSPRKSTPSPESGAKSAEDTVRKQKFQPSPSRAPPPPPPPPPLPAFYNSPPSRKLSPVQKTKSAKSEFHPPPPPPPPPPPLDYYNSSPAKLRVSNERRKSSENKIKSDERSSKRNSSRRVHWCDPIVETKEHRIIDDQRSNLGSKAVEESDDEEQRRRRREEEEYEKKIAEEGVCGSNNGSDVDKKADEFIAKFREQIRLQRIDSIKRSAYKISSANSSSSR